MYRATFPGKENKFDIYSNMLSNENADIEAQEIEPPVLDQPQQNQSTSQDEFLNTLSPASITNISPEAYARADDLFLKNLQGYKDANPEQAIKDRYKNVSEYFTANYPDPKQSIKDTDERLQAGMFARAFTDLGSAIGGAIGNKGGRARIQKEDYTPFEKDLANYKNAVAQRGAMKHKKAVAEFEQGLKNMQDVQSALIDRDASAYKYADNARNKYLDANKSTWNNSQYLNQQRIDNTNQQNEKRLNALKERESIRQSGLNQRNARTLEGKKEDKKTYILPRIEESGKSERADALLVSQIFSAIADKNKDNPNLTKFPEEIRIEDELVVRYREPKTEQERQAVLNIIAKEYPKEYRSAVIEAKINSY